MTQLSSLSFSLMQIAYVVLVLGFIAANKRTADLRKRVDRLEAQLTDTHIAIAKLEAKESLTE